ncbi:putative mutatorlike transposase [Phytophthora cinnamomi]|uniref:putative mutatorlike transposase n=1 Tax=Phytophthora cinnamomi TaxID=4785 RepID=UPI00355A3877|nr:putative mutatorlike transposase [Phytophthora cinnamomi]
MATIAPLRKEERYATIADAVAVVETFAEQAQQRRVRIQQQKPNSKAAAALGFSSTSSSIEDESAPPSALAAVVAASASSNAVVLECENAPACKWFVRLSFVKGEKKWKISSMNVDHHRSNCPESKRAVAASSDTVGPVGCSSSVTTDQLLASANASVAAALAAGGGGGEAAALMGASVYAGMVFQSWKEAIAAIRTMAHQMGRRAQAEKATQMMWRGKSVMARRILCQNHRNSNCGWMVVLDEADDGSDRYTVLSMSLLHSKECLETCNFNARKRETPPATASKSDGSMDSLGLTSTGLAEDVSKYQLTHDMRWSTGKEATKAIGDFALVVQRKRSKLCKRNNGGSNKKYVCSDEQCLWFVQLVKGWKSKNWKISAMNLKHSDTCTGVAKPTARQLAEMRFFRQAVITHSKSSGRLLTDNFLMNSESGIKIPRGMAYRAQRLVVEISTDDLTESYKFIPSLIEAFAKKNPGSIVSYEKDVQGHFIRAFIMPNASAVVLANQQQICGIQILHYDTVSYQGCLAVLVTRDGNFEYQALAFALLPTSELDHMKWFLTLAKRGGARFDGNPIYCSHSENGLLRALAHDSRHAKIMFCVRSLLDEMSRDKNIPALGPLEDMIWELQRQETEEAFSKVLGDLEALNAAAAAFLRAVHPKNWAYHLNRSVRLYRWASTGAEEAIVGSDIQRSDEAPFDLMYTFLAFLMDGIFKKSQTASKLLAVEGQSPSLLTPGADAIYRQELQAAAGFTVRRCDEQVAFAWLTGARPKITHRMDLALRTCTCGQMFQLGLPCRHFIAASMHFANEAALLDSFDPIYKATTYAGVHRNLRIEIPSGEDLHKDQSLLPAVPARNTKYKKRPRSAGNSSTSGASSTSTTDTSTAVMSAVSSSMSVGSEDSSAPLAKTPRLEEFDTDDVNSLGEIV